jgi:hypothetical protein
LIHASLFCFAPGCHGSRRAKTLPRQMRSKRSQYGGVIPGAEFYGATSTENRGTTAQTRTTLGLRRQASAFEHDERLNCGNGRRAGLPVAQELGTRAGSFWNIAGFGVGHAVPLFLVGGSALVPTCLALSIQSSRGRLWAPFEVCGASSRRKALTHNQEREIGMKPFGGLPGISLTSFCRETQNTTLNQAFGDFFHYFFLDKYVCLVAHIHS